MTDIFHCNLKNSESKEEEVIEKKESEEESNKGLKRRFDPNECTENQEGDSSKENEQSPKDGKLKRAKNVGFSLSLDAVLDYH